ncbi:hypothetical protein DYB36_001188 [Aphanomyces astaci]|uniref:Uncharacterized protein n=1 Tax=Aphanomyces astaci TaxID=112090 RepID=A0A397AS07_APHAT|nr:hypothetical protein DYB36_001188 [Aphanomyces astaci]
MLTATAKAKLVRQFATLKDDWVALDLDMFVRTHSTVATRSLALWTRSSNILAEIPSQPPAATVDDAQVSIKVEATSKLPARAESLGVVVQSRPSLSPLEGSSSWGSGLLASLVRQLWLEYTTKGFELLVAGQTPVGRVLPHPLLKMSDADWLVFLHLERERLAIVRSDCVRLAASVALRKHTCRQEQEQKRRIDRRRHHAATTVQRVFRGYVGRIKFHQVVYDDALAHRTLGAMPGTPLTSRRRSDLARRGWFQDPRTLMAFGFSSSHPVAAVQCPHWIVTHHDMHRHVLNDSHRLIRQAIAAQCIQSHVRRWLAHRSYRTLYRGVVSFQFQVRSALRRRYRRLHRATHGLSFAFARRIRHTWLLLRIRLRPPHHDEIDWVVELTGLHPDSGVAASQRIPMARLTANGTFERDEWRGMKNYDVATRIVDTTDLFYSAQSHLMTLAVGPSKTTAWQGISR